MAWVLVIAGMFAGLFVANAGFGLLGVAAGGIAGYLFFRLTALEARVRSLEGTRPAVTVQAAAPVRVKSSAQPAEQPVPPPIPASMPAPIPEPEPPPSPPKPAAAPVETAARSQYRPRTPIEPQTAPRADRESPVDALIALAKGWLTTGNVPVKVGIIILFFGVAFLLKYAVEQQILSFPPGARLVAVALLGGTVFAVGWRLRTKSRTYALNLQGAGIGVLYLTIYAGLRLYAVLPASVTFALLILLTVAGGALAVMQNARGLAVMASVGGFLAPVLTSAGMGSHVALFSYYLVLNAAVLGISWYRAWRSLNLVGFLFTFGVGTVWGFEYYIPELYASTQPFLVLNFLFYQGIAILFAFRQPPDLRGYVDGTIIFGTPLIAFGLQTQLVANTEYGLAISAGCVALFYAAVAGWLYRRHAERMHLLVRSFALLSIGFATIAVPLALDDRWSAIAWALEGVGVVWLGVNQNGRLSRLTGTALLFGSGYFYIEHGWKPDLGIAVLNGNVFGGVIISCASLLAARLLERDERKMHWQGLMSTGLLLWGTAWWLGTGAAEINDRASGSAEFNLFLTFFAASFLLLGWLAHRITWLGARRLTLAYLPALVPLALLYLWDRDHFFRDWGAVAWTLSMAVHPLLLRLADAAGRRTLFAWHTAGALFIAAILSQECYWRVRMAGLGEVWRFSAAMLVPLLGSGALVGLRHRLPWPVRAHWGAYRAACGIALTTVLTLLLLQSIADPGNPAPLGYVPIFNPMDVLTLLATGIALWCLRIWLEEAPRVLDIHRHGAAIGWGLITFLLTTLAVVRGVHHLGDVPWNEFALRRSVLVQASLSIYWALLGFSGMIVGARRAHYWTWVVGIGLMGIVVAKLFFVDLGNTGTVARIVSFLGVGMLLLVVGYFAPRPPRTDPRVSEQP